MGKTSEVSPSAVGSSNNYISPFQESKGRGSAGGRVFGVEVTAGAGSGQFVAEP